jgi:hypothetical protein
MTITHHPLSDGHAEAMRRMRQALQGANGAVTGPEVRPMFDTLMEAVPAYQGVVP